MQRMLRALPILLSLSFSPLFAQEEVAQNLSSPPVAVSNESSPYISPVIEPEAGEPSNGFPSWSERVVHEWVNRARSDPQFELASCPSCADRACYTPQPPLGFSVALGKAARFHADEMRAQGYFSHDSKCTVLPTIGTLYPASCDGSAACACLGGLPVCGTGGCTRWYNRVAFFGGFARYENIASPSEPNQAFYLWLYEGTSSAACTFSGTNGHRWSILTATGGMGAGIAGGTAVIDFGDGNTPTGIASAVHYPRSGDSVDVWANWYAPSEAKSASVVLDGVCIPMSLKRGSKNNGAWSATLSSLGSKCHFYYVTFTDAAGGVTTYPTTGSYVIGEETCGDWVASRQKASCAPNPTPSRKRPVRRR